MTINVDYLWTFLNPCKTTVFLMPKVINKVYHYYLSHVHSILPPPPPSNDHVMPHQAYI